MNKSYRIFLNSKANNIDELFSLLADYAVSEKVVANSNEFLEALKEREAISSTGLENGIAIPHGISYKIKKHFIFVASLVEAIEWKTFDNSKVKTIICFAVPKKTEVDHLKLLQKVSIMLMDKHNQTLLNSGDFEAIDSLFSKIAIKTNIQEDVNKNSNIEQNVEKEEIDDKHDENLFAIREELIKKYQIKKYGNLKTEIKKVEEEIQTCKNNISKLKIEQKRKKEKLSINYKKSYQIDSLELNKEKQIAKSKLADFKIDNNKKRLLLKTKRDGSDASKEKLAKFNYQSWVQKSKILEKTNSLILQKAKISTDFKDQKQKIKENYTTLLKINRYKIVNPKNIFYIHGNKIQLVIMIILAVVGLWGIVLGSIGVDTIGGFITSDISLWASLNIVGFNQSSLDVWVLTVIANNQSVAISAIAFGMLSFILMVPLKLWKIQSVTNELKAILTSIIGFVSIIVTTVLVFLSIDNISNFESWSSKAITLNSDFENALTLNNPLLSLADFDGNEANFNLYVARIQAIFSEYGIGSSFDDANRLLALQQAKIAASTDFTNIVLML